MENVERLYRSYPGGVNRAESLGYFRILRSCKKIELRLIGVIFLQMTGYSGNAAIIELTPLKIFENLAGTSYQL